MTDPQEWYCPRCRTWKGPDKVSAPPGHAERHTCGTPVLTAEELMQLAGLGLLEEADEQVIQESTATNTALVVGAMREKAAGG